MARAWIRKGWLDQGDDSVLADCVRQDVIDASITSARDELEIPEPDIVLVQREMEFCRIGVNRKWVTVTNSF